MRETIFISHATPEDNDFTIWLASRLELLGYKVWIDKDELLGGEKFWETIDNVIREETIKFLLVYSKNIFQKDINGIIKPGRLKDGVYKEYSFAESIAKYSRLSDFIVLVNIDNSDYNLFIGADRLNQIPFYENWSTGLKQLEKKLTKDLIPKKSEFESSEFGEWYGKQFVNQQGITTKNELYYSNWWAIPKLPDYFYIYQFNKKEQADSITKQIKDFPISQITNNISSFEDYILFEVNIGEDIITIKPQHKYKIPIKDIFIGIKSEKFPTQRDAENHFKQLLKKVFHQIMKNRGMFWYEMSNKKFAYYYTTSNLTTLKVRYEFLYRKQNKFKSKNLIGKPSSKGRWHYAISSKPILSPVLGFSLKNHLAFTDDGLNVWKNDKNEVDKERIHRERRKKGKRLFNEEWRDLFLAFLNALKKDDKITINLSSDFILEMPTYPEVFWANFGYFDPKDKTRQGLLGIYEIDDRNIDEND